MAWFGALRRLPASTAAVGILLAPVLGVFSSAALLGDPLGVRQMVALALTVGGIALASRE
jgi:drug/metabolite transporter (DMT)-like permease